MTNEQKIVFGSIARTVSVTSHDLYNANAKGAHIVIDVTNVGVVPSVVFKVQGKDPASQKYYDIIQSSPISTTGTIVLGVYPGFSAVSNLIANNSLPQTFRIVAEHSNSVTITYSVGVNMIK